MRTTFLSLALLLTGAVSAHAQNSANDPTAIAILNRMADNIGALHSVSFRLEASHDVYDADAGTLVKRHDYHEVSLVGPDKMLVNTTGDVGQRGFWYDGKNAYYYFYGENNYGRMPAPPTIIATIDSLHDAFGIDFPAADFIYPTFVDDLVAQSQKIVFDGRARIGGQDCFHIVARGASQDVQIWVANDGANLPVKYVIRDKAKSQDVEYEGTFSDWRMNPDLPATMFGFMPPPGAKQVRMLSRNAKSKGARP